MNVTVGDCQLTLDVLAGVHVPTPAAIKFAETIEVRREDAVLDLGTGTGLIALMAAHRGAARVCGIDCDPAAVEIAFRNAEANRLTGKVEFRVGDWFIPVGGERFDVICVNPPQTPAASPIRPDRWGGSDGSTHLGAVIRVAPSYLRPKGRLHLMHSTLAHPKRVMAALAERFDVKILGEDPRPFTFREFDELGPGIGAHLRDLRKRGVAEFEETKDGGTFMIRYLRAQLK